MLLAAGASPSALNASSRTPVDEAQAGGHQAALDAIFAASGGGEQPGDGDDGDGDGDGFGLDEGGEGEEEEGEEEPLEELE